MPRPRLFLVDAFNFIFRAYHARARSGAAPMRTSRGTSTEAVFIFHNMLRRLQRQYSPEYFAVAYESPGKTFRDEAFLEYKATRSETPAELIEQIPLAETLLGAMGIPVLKLAGYEADDVIATLARQTANDGVDVVIVSSDKDLLQLVDDRVKMLDPMKNDTLYDADKVVEFKGVRPEQIPDLLALVGDTSDNIPGAPGIGEKGATQLLQTYGTVENTIAHAAEITAKRQRESLQNHTEQILLSKRLATVATEAPLPFKLEDLAARGPDREMLAAMYRDLEFLSFLKELQASDPTSAAAEPEPAFDAEPETLVVYDWKKHIRDTGLAGPAPEKPVEDVLLMSFLVLSDPSAVSLDNLIARFLERPPATETETLQLLARKLRPLLDEDLLRVYREIDLPLSPVLARMELDGIRVDTAVLNDLGKSMETDIQRLVDEIYGLAGKPFNIQSPAQLGQILFEELKLPAMGRTGKTKNYSTAADVLESLALQYPIAKKVLDYRQITKLKSTYVDALAVAVDPATSRVHTTFNQAGAATGRLSSSDPNLQNIPTRTEAGREIRAAFVPEPGWQLLSADYSQIELRLLAHFSRDPVLLDSFRKNEDIHTRTASEVFGVAPLMVTPELRRNAKAVNFGIVYGQTPFGLAAQLGIPREEADRYIRGYFERYAGVKKWIDATIEQTRKLGLSRTMFGRRRPIPDIESKNPNARGFAERTAVNTPLQGTAADLLKIAMIRIQKEIGENKMRTRMLLQVHDELVLETPPEEAQQAAAMVKRQMETVVKIEVPLLVETGLGPNWRDAK